MRERSAGKHLYFHVPFCDGKCVYCAFYSELYNGAIADDYVGAAGKELDLSFQGARPSPETIYFGGGTPSILSDDALARMCRQVAEKVSLDCLKEWTVEANPGTLSQAKLDILKSAGVNRISIGVQSFDDMVLKRIGRRHSAGDVGVTVRQIREAGIVNIGLDLIACLDGVDETMWRRTIKEALALEPDHLSVYALTVERGTRLDQAVKSGTVEPAADDSVLDALYMAEKILHGRGYGRYEISNYARPGCECLHNLSFWRGDDYLGFGPSGSSRDGLRRWTNLADTGGYVAALNGGTKPPCDEEILSPVADVGERLAFAFRLNEGVDLRRFSVNYGVEPALEEKWCEILGELSGSGVTEFLAGRWRLTREGRAMADYVAEKLL